MLVDELVGQRLGPCVLDAVIAKGGNGTVYRGRHVTLDRPVAVKVIALKSGEKDSNRWLAEARAAARLQDSRIVQVHDAGVQGGFFYVVMQLIDGETLAQIVGRTGPMDPARALEVMREAVRGIAAAHRAGLVHRDIKPDNIMVAADGTVRILDFGCAALAGRVVAEDPEGSWDFASPEQGFGAAPDPREDLYSFGATFYFCLAGRPPYGGMTPHEVVVHHRKSPVPDVRQARPDVLPAMAELISRLMQKDPGDRPGSAEEVVGLLLSPQMRMEMDTSGSPFKILPPPPEPEPEGLANDPEMAPLIAQQPVVRARAMPAPPPPAPLPHKPRLNFVVLLAAAAFWAWKLPEAGFSGGDWLGAGACSGALLLLLAFQESRAAAVRAGAVLLFALMAFAFARLAGPLQVFTLEPAATGALGLAAGLGGVVLGFFSAWRDHKTGAALLGASAVLLAVAAAGWNVSGEGAAWLVAAQRNLGSLFSSLSASGGLRRWEALAVAYAVYVVRRSFG